MEKLSVLQKWSKLLFVLGVVILFFVPGVVLIALIKPEMVPFEFTINDDKDFTAGVAIVTLVTALGFGCYLYSLYLFRKILTLFSKRKIFDIEVITNFRKMGLYTWYGVFITAVPGPLYRFFTTEGIKVSFDAQWIGYVLFTGSLALFFTVLSEVFKMATNIKEENDLTV